MNKINKAIFNFLDEYIHGGESDYAVFLKGQWGCGKTHFIKEWIKHVNDDSIYDEDYDIDLKPLYVSLYGLSDTFQVSESIRKELHPILNSKVVKKIKKILIGFGSVALKTNLNDKFWSGDKSEVSVNLDLLDILSTDDKSLRIKGEKILVFDDFERCNIPKDQLLGFINNFVEHSSCYVIIVGDDTKLEEEKANFERIKEKTIGRTFEIQPEVDDAINDFISKADPENKYYLAESSIIIKNLFYTSEKKNLRILKHALFDYTHCIKRCLNDKHKDNPTYRIIIKTLLANFVFCYLELYQTQIKVEDVNREDSAPANGRLAADLESSIKDKAIYIIQKVQLKYESFAKLYKLSIPNIAYCDTIIDYLYNGTFNDERIKEEIAVQIEIKKPILILANLEDISDDDFNKYYPEVVKAFRDEIYDDITDIFDGSAILMYYNMFIDSEIKDKEIIDHADNMLKVDNLSLEKLYQNKATLHFRYNIYKGLSPDKSLDMLFNRLNEKLDSEIKNRKDPIAHYLENISNENIQDINDKLNSPIPDKSKSYNLTSIFEDVDVDNFIESYKLLSNKSRNIFGRAIIGHYRVVTSTTNITDYIQDFEGDIKPLKEMASRLKQLKENDKPIGNNQAKELGGWLELYAKALSDLLDIQVIKQNQNRNEEKA